MKYSLVFSIASMRRTEAAVFRRSRNAPSGRGGPETHYSHEKKRFGLQIRDASTILSLFLQPADSRLAWSAWVIRN
jgi:hypothetical protein